MAHRLLTLTVPLADNDGDAYDSSHFTRIESALLERFGGFTRVAVSGAWIADDGRRYDDCSVRYETLTDDGLAADWLTGYASVNARVLRQECVLVTATAVDRVEFVS